MENWNKNFCYRNDEELSSIFNGRIPSLVINIDISQLPESPSTECLEEIPDKSVLIDSENSNRSSCEAVMNDTNETKSQTFESSFQHTQKTECLEKIPVECVPITCGKRKRTNDDEDLMEATKEMKHITLESLLHKANCFQEFPNESEINILEETETQMLDKDIENVDKNISYETSTTKASTSSFQTIQCSQEINPGTECFQEVGDKSEISLLRETQMEMPLEDSDNVENNISYETGLSETPVQTIQNVECSQEIKQRTEHFQDVSSQSEFTHLTEIRMLTEDLENAENIYTDGIEINQMPEMRTECFEEITPRNDCLKNITTESESELLECMQVKKVKETLINFERNTCYQTGAFQISEPVFQKTECSQERNPINECFQDVSTEFEYISLGDAQKQTPVENFENFEKNNTECFEGIDSRTKCFQEIPTAPELTLFGEIQMLTESSENAENNNSYGTGTSITPEKTLENTQSLPEITNGTECFENVTVEFESVHLGETQTEMVTEDLMKVNKENNISCYETGTIQSPLFCVPVFEKSQFSQSVNSISERFQDAPAQFETNIIGQIQMPKFEENSENFENDIIYETEISQANEPLFLHTDCSQETQIQDYMKDFKNVENNISCEISTPSFQDIVCSKEINIEAQHADSDNQKRKADGEYQNNSTKKVKCEISALSSGDSNLCLQKRSSKSAPTISGKGTASVKNFKYTVKKVKRAYKPNMQLAMPTVQILDNLVCHVLDIFDEELNAMKRLKSVKTLSQKQLESLIKLSLPPTMCAKAIKFGQLAVQKLEKS